VTGVLRNEAHPGTASDETSPRAPSPRCSGALARRARCTLHALARERWSGGALRGRELPAKPAVLPVCFSLGAFPAADGGGVH